MVRIWDVMARALRVPPLRHPGWVWSVAVSHDGRTILTGCEDRKARLWDLASGVPLGPAIPHLWPVKIGRFSPDGETFLTDDGPTRRVFRGTAQLPDDLDRVAAWVEVLTGLALDPKHGSIEVLDNAAWRAALERLERLGGPAETGEDQRLDPILFGPDPGARARAWSERRQWQKAREASDEVRRARPSKASYVIGQDGLGGGHGPQSGAVVTPSVSLGGSFEPLWIRRLAEFLGPLTGNLASSPANVRPARPATGPPRADESGGASRH